jgi:hypothetical protein
MRTLVIAALFLAACGDDSSSTTRDLTDCDPAWGVAGSCEVACKTMPTYGPPPGCVASHEPYDGPAAASLAMCTRFADIPGTDGTLHRGCCMPEGDDIQFWECCQQQGGDGTPVTYRCP